MARKNILSMAETLAEFKDLKNIDKDTLISVLQDSFKSVVAKMFEAPEDLFTVIVNPETGDFEIWRNRTVVEGDIRDVNAEITEEGAHAIDPDAEIGDIVSDSIDFSEFGRRAILNLRQALAGKVMDLQKEALYSKFKEKIGELVSAVVYQVWKREVLLIDDEGNELLLPKNEQIPGDFYKKDEVVRCVVDRVDNENNLVKIYVSRTSPEFLKRLFELNVPEIGDGLITIKRVVRLPGERAKMAVESYDERIDPVGACVGMNGSRIRSIVRELKGENIDVIPFTSNPILLIQRALSPAKITNVKIIADELKAEVSLPPEEVPLAIGKNASNIKLAKALTGYDIEVFRDIDEEGEDDILLDEFADAFEDWVIDMFKQKGLTTAKSVLRIPKERLATRVDLEVETIERFLNELATEFSEEDLRDIGYMPAIERYRNEQEAQQMAEVNAEIELAQMEKSKDEALDESTVSPEENTTQNTATEE